ncbi:cytochrome c biogenesis protein ResB [Cellulomonas sp. ATA003]|uniref:cytochrome c biogenesis protein ResB n=1 Tax=Cellulomonas sp. ATA003 TaxID=3073064 RepID=UPI0028734214|nr:cytochrome c biogenesis protein ResB [Cellulomonas sp. ATA003]WNB86980.1 cytochrome c biogenesis protein ResB [Cellulomonas sp. ATA003]
MSGYRPEGIDDTFSAPDRGEAAKRGTGTATDARIGSAPGARGAAGGTPGSGSGDGPVLPQLGVVGWLRWTWRQITSMRVALLLLMLLAVAAVPGSVLPQRPQDPAGVAQYLKDNAGTGEWLDRLGAFDVYASVWFSAIYLLLFTSLIGCILPRTRAHLAAMRARPPRTPRRFARFPAQGSLTTSVDPQAVVHAAAGALRGPHRWLPRFRVDVRQEVPAGDRRPATWVLSAERGYLRETGNLVFHLSLVGLLVAMGAGQFLHYRGQAIVLEGQGFANAEVGYDTFESGAGFDPESLVPFALTLDKFTARFDPETLLSRYFRADVTVREPDGTTRTESIQVNHPLTAGGAKIYLMGNGYAPEVTIRDSAGELAFAGPVPFLPEDTVYTSRGVIKVPDVSTGEQIGLVGFLLPSAVESGPGLWRSVNPQPNDPLLVLSVWTGDLGLDEGVPQNVYQLDESRMTQVVDDTGAPVTLYVRPGETVDLPNELGTISIDGMTRFVALDLRHDPTLVFVLVFALTALAGLATSLFTPRRRVWVRASPAPDRPGHTTVEVAALARGDDLGLQGELDRLLSALSDTGNAPQAAEEPAPAEEDVPRGAPVAEH